MRKLNLSFPESVHSGWLIFMVVIMVYLPAMNFDVQQDDAYYTESRYVKKGTPGIMGVFLTPQAGLEDDSRKDIKTYRPLALTSFAFEYAAGNGQLNLRVSHLINILLYAFSCLLLFWLLLWALQKKLDSTRAFWTSFFTVFFFSLHPVHTEAVASLSGRAELLSFFFSVLTLLLLFQTASGRFTLKGVMILPIGLSFLAALTAKEHSLILLLLIPLVLHVFTTLKKWEYMLLCIPFWILAGLYFWVRAFTDTLPPDGIFTFPFSEAELTEKLGAVLSAMKHYIRLLIVPAELSHDYSFAEIGPVSPFGFDLILSGFLVVFGILWSILFIDVKNILAFGLLFCLTPIALYSGGLFADETLVHEPLMLLPSFGLSLFLITGGFLLIERFGEVYKHRKANIRLAFLLAFAFLNMSFAAKTINRTQVWKDTETLLVTDVGHSPQSLNLRLKTGKFFLSKCKDKTSDAEAKECANRAVRHLEKAVNIDADASEAWFLLGKTYALLQKDNQKVSQSFQRALVLNPGFADAHAELGKAYFHKNDFKKAASYFSKWMKLEAKNPVAYLHYGKAQEELRHSDSAFAAYSQVISLMPRNVEALTRLGRLYVQAYNNREKAVELFRKAIEQDPVNAEVHELLGVAYKEQENPDKAIPHFKKAIRFNPDNAVTYLNLGMTYRQIGDSAQAKHYLEKAFSIDPELYPKEAEETEQLL